MYALSQMIEWVIKEVITLEDTCLLVDKPEVVIVALSFAYASMLRLVTVVASGAFHGC